MLIDEVQVQLTAGSGGKGAVAWNNIKRQWGPTGADGGRGASIWFEGSSDISLLMQFKSRSEIRAQNGEDGKAQFRDGARAEDLILKIPTGTTITNLGAGEQREITKVGERLLAVKGGEGGRGNFKFKSSTHQSPYEYEEGRPGETAPFQLELKLIADIGLVGLPNAGKSSLLNALTAAKARVGNYHFTTLEPNLGVSYGVILADIPGLIEGAAEGKGLGTKFLRHIERTSVIFHLIAADSHDSVGDYATIIKELETYSPLLRQKKEYIFLSKSDTVSPEQLEKQVETLKASKIKATPISIYDDESLDTVRKVIHSIREEKQI